MYIFAEVLDNHSPDAHLRDNILKSATAVLLFFFLPELTERKVYTE